jgi:hypothetical protein
MEITTIGLDLAKNVFQIHGVDMRGRRCCASNSRATRLNLLFFIASSLQLGIQLLTIELV